MLRRKFGKHDFDSSILGFGVMRMPILDRQTGEINEPEAIKMIRYAIDHGVDYIDTAYNYHREKGEQLVAKALKDGYRKRVKIATKLPSWLVKSHEDCDRLLNKQLQHLETDHIDLYLLHNLNTPLWKSLKEHRVFEFIERALADGRIKHIGFSFHDNLDLFRETIDAYDWDFCQIQLNYLDENFQAGIEGMRYAASKGIPVVVMEPLRGGGLADNVPQEVQAVWNEALCKRTPAEWALRWVWNMPEVSVVLSGMSTIQHVEENIRTASEALPDSLTEQELALIDRVKQLYKARIKVGCTQCNYCMPCPSQIPVPLIFERYNEASMFGTSEQWMRGFYKHLIDRKGDVSVCSECGQCEAACPQSLPIREYLKEFKAAYGPSETNS